MGNDHGKGYGKGSWLCRSFGDMFCDGVLDLKCNLNVNQVICFSKVIMSNYGDGCEIMECKM